MAGMIFAQKAGHALLPDFMKNANFGFYF